MESVIYSLVQIAIVVLLAPLPKGISGKVKALSQKREGPPLLQMYYDLAKLIKKDTVVSDTASWIFRVTPYLTLTTVLTAALFVPVSVYLRPPGFFGDIILVIYLFACGRFFMTLAGLDTGSTFGGMGSSREMMISSLLEPALLVAVITVGLITGAGSVHGMMQSAVNGGTAVFQPAYLLTFLAIFIVLIGEACRVPVDDPSTHLELTMVHEAMLLEYSGRYLALMELGAAVKELIFITLLANLFLPVEGLFSLASPALALAVSLLLYLLKVVVITVLVGLTEVFTVKLRLFSLPNLAALSFTLAFLGFVQHFMLGR